MSRKLALCYKLDKAKKRLSLSQSTNALAESGTDPETTEIRNLVENSGFVWALGKSKGKTGEIVTTRALVNAYRLLGGAAFTRMLHMLWDAWQGDPRSLTAAVLSGMALFVKTYETEMNACWLRYRYKFSSFRIMSQERRTKRFFTGGNERMSVSYKSVPNTICYVI